MKKKIVYTLLAIIVLALLYTIYSQSSMIKSSIDVEHTLPADAIVDSVVVLKSKRELHVFAKGKRLKVYHVALGTHPVGHKQYEGDGKTPEGLYTINDRNPNSDYHKNLGISYPNAADRDSALAKGLSPGGDVKIHGLRNGFGAIGNMHRTRDWTAGCIAVTDEEIDELYRAVKIGSPIRIKP